MFPAALVCLSPMEAKRLDSNPSSKICCTLSNYSWPGKGGLQHLNGKLTAFVGSLIGVATVTKTARKNFSCVVRDMSPSAVEITRS